MSRFRTVWACCLALSLLFCIGCPNAAFDQHVRAGKYLMLNLGKGVKMKLMRIGAGKFVMGSPKTETDREDEEGPQREVTISRPFYMGIHEVTRSQWRAVMNTRPWDGDGMSYTICRDANAASWFSWNGETYDKSGASNPIIWITWDEASKFCEMLSKKTGKQVSLPTEAQWEYACRAGSKTAYSFGDDASKLGDYAWYCANTYKRGVIFSQAVGRKKPNAFGLYDMHGNVWEWCRDWYAKNSYAKAKNVDPENTTETGSRVLRGGSWGYLPQVCRAAYRGWFTSGFRSHDVGFRVVVASCSGVDRSRLTH